MPIIIYIIIGLSVFVYISTNRQQSQPRRLPPDTNLPAMPSGMTTEDMLQILRKRAATRCHSSTDDESSLVKENAKGRENMSSSESSFAKISAADVDKSD